MPTINKPAVSASSSNANGGTRVWGSPGNVLPGNASCATSSGLGSVSERLIVVLGGDAVPDTAQDVQFTLRIRRGNGTGTGAGVKDSEVTTSAGGGNLAKSPNWGPGQNWFDYVFAVNAFTPAQLNDAGFAGHLAVQFLGTPPITEDGPFPSAALAWEVEGVVTHS
jgi:hypothetical protein